jgi:uncharacterized RDD family membrane protein YckC
MAETDWVVQRDGNRFPVPDVVTLQQWAQSGRIGPNDQVWSPLRGDWSAASTTPEIASLMVRPSAPVVAQQSVARASMALRGVGYVIDVVPSFLVGLIGLIPVVGQFIAGITLGFYWLYRDAENLSIGKRLLGLAVVQTDGSPASRHALVRRNVPFGIAAFLGAVPIIGLFLAPIAGFIVFAATVIFLASEGFSLGDKWAGTTVIKRA